LVFNAIFTAGMRARLYRVRTLVRRKRSCQRQSDSYGVTRGSFCVTPLE
jgi:hypothetical protein